MIDSEYSPLDSIDFAGYFLALRELLPGQAVVRDGHSWLHFSGTSRVVTAMSLADVGPRLECADAHVKNGGWAVGFVSYEAGAGLNESLPSKLDERPLAWFALFDEPPKRYRELLPVYEAPAVELEPLEWDEAEYTKRFDVVKEALRVGRTYQVNLTMRQRFQLSGSAADFFAARCGVNPPPYATFINGGDWAVASFSPELFFERIGSEISSKPMKGTVVRPKDRVEEIEAARALAADPKSMAENIMIVDMVRNDMGAVAEVGSVKAPKLLEVERHRDLLQMTSTVTALSSASTLALFKGMFPPASVTGAPKVSTCRMIAELETSPRGVYCGAIGFMAPGHQRFSVAIRTAWIDETGQGEFGIGSGLVWDSEAEQEYVECLAKRDFLLNSGTQWSLIEAVPGHEIRKADVVDRHLKRLDEAAEAFQIRFDPKALRKELSKLPESPKEERMKVRVLLRTDGSFAIDCSPSAMKGERLTAIVAPHPIDRRDQNLRFKTTSRRVYEELLDAYPEFDEVLLYNDRGELTEFCRGNVVVEEDGMPWTPDPDSGCLNGVGIARLVDDGTAVYGFGGPRVGLINEGADVYFVNSVVGMMPVDVTPRPNTSVADLTELAAELGASYADLTLPSDKTPKAWQYTGGLRRWAAGARKLKDLRLEGVDFSITAEGVACYGAAPEWQRTVALAMILAASSAPRTQIGVEVGQYLLWAIAEVGGGGFENLDSLQDEDLRLLLKFFGLWREFAFADTNDWIRHENPKDAIWRIKVELAARGCL